MPSKCLRALALLACLTNILGPAWAAEPEKITFASNNSKATSLVGYLFRPIGAGPFPAVVALHGCGGLFTKNGRLQDRNVNWADHLTAAGIAVLFPDSFNPRGVSQLCTLKQAERPVVPFGRSFDANGAADWLATQPFIDRTRLGLLGWSHGGSAVLWSVRGGVKPRIADFRTAIAFYPGCRVPFESSSWAPRLPLKILMGTADDWTPPQPCRDLAKKHNVPMIEYPGAYHAFDTPNSPVRVLKGLGMTADGSGRAHVGTDPAARAASIAEVMTTFKAAFGMGQ